MTRYWFTADTHFDVYDSSRPFGTVEAMNQELIGNWNGLVSPEDTVFHLGDVGWYDRFPNWVIPLLNGRKVLVRGNHDNLPIRVYKEYFDEVEDGPLFLRFSDVNGKEYVLSLSHAPHEGRRDMFRLHGDVHRDWRSRPGLLNVGVDVWGYRPVSMDEVMQFYITDPIYGHEVQRSQE